MVCCGGGGGGGGSEGCPIIYELWLSQGRLGPDPQVGEWVNPELFHPGNHNLGKVNVCSESIVGTFRHILSSKFNRALPTNQASDYRAQITVSK